MFGDAPSRPGEPGRVARSVTSRVLSVLDAFAGEHRRLTLSDISRRTGRTISRALFRRQEGT